MTRPITNATLTALATLLLVACSGSKDEAPPTPPVTYQEMPKPPRQDRAVYAATPHDVPVAEDFEDEAEAEISVDSFRHELDRLESEIKNDRAE